MTKAIFIFIACFIFFTSCNKKTESTTTVTYQVTATNSNNIQITYNNVLGNKVMVTASNGWAFDVIDPPKPFSASLSASATSPFSSITTTCTVNILVNGATVKTATMSSNTVATAEAEYTIQ